MNDTDRGAPDFQATFEHSRVQMLLAACGFTVAEQNRHAAALREAGRQFGADGYLAFRALYESERFQDFPVRLKAFSFNSDKGVLDLRSCLKDFTVTSYHHYYLRFWQTHRHNDPKPLGVVFNYPGGGIILHNAALTGDADGRFAATYRSADPDEPPMLTLESYRGFLKRVVPLWATMAVPIPSTRPQAEIEPKLEKWMVERFGSGPAVIVVAWLRGAMADPEKRHFEMLDGESWLCVTQDLVAAETGLGEDAVKRGLAKIKEGGLIVTRIVTHQGNRRTFIRPKKAKPDQ